jgi:hypothetical protein
VEKLLGKGIKAEEINEHKIGRFMDEIWKYSLEKLWINIALKAINKYQFSTKYSHNKYIEIAPKNWSQLKN